MGFELKGYVAKIYTFNSLFAKEGVEEGTKIEKDIPITHKVFEEKIDDYIKSRKLKAINIDGGVFNVKSTTFHESYSNSIDIYHVSNLDVDSGEALDINSISVFLIRLNSKAKELRRTFLVGRSNSAINIDRNAIRDEWDDLFLRVLHKYNVPLHGVRLKDDKANRSIIYTLISVLSIPESNEIDHISFINEKKILLGGVLGDYLTEDFVKEIIFDSKFKSNYQIGTNGIILGLSDKGNPYASSDNDSETSDLYQMEMEYWSFSRIISWSNRADPMIVLACWMKFYEELPDLLYELISSNSNIEKTKPQKVFYARKALGEFDMEVHRLNPIKYGPMIQIWKLMQLKLNIQDSYKDLRERFDTYADIIKYEQAEMQNARQGVNNFLVALVGIVVGITATLQLSSVEAWYALQEWHRNSWVHLLFYILTPTILIGLFSREIYIWIKRKWR